MMWLVRNHSTRPHVKFFVPVACISTSSLLADETRGSIMMWLVRDHGTMAFSLDNQLSKDNLFPDYSLPMQSLSQNYSISFANLHHFALKLII